MNEETAAEIVQRGERLFAELNDMVRLAQQSGMNGEEFHQFRRTVGRIMGELHLELLTPIYESFPHLTPSDLRPNSR